MPAVLSPTPRNPFALLRLSAMCFIMRITVNRQIWSSVILQILRMALVKMVVFIDDYSLNCAAIVIEKSGVLGKKEWRGQSVHNADIRIYLTLKIVHLVQSTSRRAF